MSQTTCRATGVSLAGLLILVAATACSSRTLDHSSAPAHPTRQSTAASASHTIAPPVDRYLGHVALLAHDELGGRGTGSSGIDLAAGYIAGQFAAAGLKPGGPNGTYFQEFTLSRGAEVREQTTLAVEGPDRPAVLRTDFIPFGFSAQASFSGNFVFAGYGITNPDKGYDDYAGLDPAGCVLLMFRREPPGWDPAGEFTQHARFDHKVKLAADKGASAVLIVNQDPGPDGIDGLMRFTSRGDTYGIPAMHVTRRWTDELLRAGGLAPLADLQRQLDSEGRCASAPLVGVRVRGAVAYESKDMLARNVIGVLEGMGPSADEYVVIGGHYDHLGTRRGRIYNGADDNASGTAGVIELAYALAGAPYRNRSVIFMAFSAEEIGLDGSEHFVGKPTVEMDSIVAMLNMDMIGRLNPDQEANRLSIQGLGTGDNFSDIIERRTKEAGMEYLPDPSALGPSDHASFYEAGVPALFFFTGVHPDYHQPGDDTEKVNVQGAVQIVSLVYQVALDIINDETAPVYAEVSEPANVFRGASPFGSNVVMGIMPDMEDDSKEPGWRVANVFPGGGADKAGMKAGDRILLINGQAVSDLSDYLEIVRDKQPGDTLEVTVRRGEQEVKLAVELSARPARS